MEIIAFTPLETCNAEQGAAWRVWKSGMFHLTTATVATVHHFQQLHRFGPNQISSDLIKKAFAKVLAIPSNALLFHCDLVHFTSS